VPLPLPFARTELRYRTLTHINPGRCLVELHDQGDGRGVLAVASRTLGPEAAAGPSLVNGASAIATGIQRDLLPEERRCGELTLVLRTATGPCLVAFAESFDGWFARPSFEPLTDAGLADLAAPGPRTAAG
jgi:hypothetical protein